MSDSDIITKDTKTIVKHRHVRRLGARRFVYFTYSLDLTFTHIKPQDFYFSQVLDPMDWSGK